MQRTLLTILFVLVFSLGASSQKRLTEVDLKVNGVGPGTSYLAVIKHVGQPRTRKTEKFADDETCSGHAETHLTLEYSGLALVLLGDADGNKLSVYSMAVTSPTWSASGIQLGASLAGVRRRFGKPVSISKIGSDLFYYYVTPGNRGAVTFKFRDNKLTSVRMNETLC